jgi:hypothetical protein
MLQKDRSPNISLGTSRRLENTVLAILLVLLLLLFFLLFVTLSVRPAHGQACTLTHSVTARLTSRPPAFAC